MYNNPKDPDNYIIKNKIKDWLVKYSLASSSVSLEITELKCADDHCPCITTVLSVEGDEICKYQIAKPLVFVREWDIKGLLLQK